MSTTRRRRAAPLSPDERREALVTAVVPLLATHGRDISTRQIADAAGVAEGTIFRAFPDKESLLDAAVERAFDMTELNRQLAALDRTPPLDVRVRSVVELLRRRLEDVYRLLIAIRPPFPARPADPAHAAHHRARVEQTEQLERSIAAILGPDGGLLGADHLEAARWLRLSVMAATHPLLTGGHRLATDRIVALVLGGIAGAVTHQPRSGQGPPC